MRLAGIGVDVVAVERIARVRQGRSDLIAAVCGPEELPVPGPAGDRWAACLWAGKEAVAKSLGTGLWQAGVDWKDIRLGRDGTVRFLGGAARHAEGSVARVDFAPSGGLLIAVAMRWFLP